MQTQHLNAAGLCGFGEIVPDCPAEGYAAVRREFAPGEETEKLSASCPVVLEYGGGMSLLVLHGSETRAFYLDRIVRLEPETVFSIVPVGEHSAVIFHLPEGEMLQTCGVADAAALAGVKPSLRIGSLMTFFYQECARDFYFRGERHGAYELVCVDSGRLHTLVSGRDIVLEQQELTVIGRNEWHMQYADGAVRFLTIAFDLAEGSLESIVGQRLPLNAGLRALVARLLQEHERQGSYFYDSVEALLKLLLLELLRTQHSGEAHTETARMLPATLRTENELVDRALQIIARSIRQKLTLSSLAEELYISVPYLHRLFDSHLGISPGKYITKIRLEECKAMLREGRLTVGAIAKEMGYSSIQHFSRQFHHSFGISPTEYARLLR